VFSGLLWGGPPRQILNLARTGHFQLYSSNTLLLELADVLGRSKFAARIAQYGAAQTLLDGYAALAEVIDPDHTVPVVSADPDDGHVLACAITIPVDYIVSGDRHLLDLGRYENIPILNAVDFLAIYTESLTP